MELPVGGDYAWVVDVLCVCCPGETSYGQIEFGQQRLAFGATQDFVV